MNPFSLIRMLLSSLPNDRWIVSVNDARKGPVTRTSSRLSGSNVEVDFAYQDGDTAHELKGTVPLVTAGRPGGNDQFTFDGAVVEHDDFLLSSRFTLSGPILVVEFKFQQAGHPVHVRFDGRILG